MQNTMEASSIVAPGDHLPRQKLQQYRQLSTLLEQVHQQGKSDEYMKKLTNGGASEKTAACFRHLREIKKREAAALKILENYLKTDTLNDPTHHHAKDLDRLSRILQGYNQTGGWF